MDLVKFPCCAYNLQTQNNAKFIIHLKGPLAFCELQKSLQIYFMSV